MSAVYSKAFDHLIDSPLENENGDYSYQDPEVVQSCSTFRRSSGAGQSGAIRRKPTDINRYPVTNDMGQNHSAQYIDACDIEPRRHGAPPTQHYTPDSDPMLRRGHHNEDSTEYCYAHSVDVMATRRPKPPIQPRSVSLRDDYSQPHDRLSSYESTQDYTEPYQTKDCHSTKVTAPESGDIYSLAKDVEGLREADLDHYNHINDGIKKSSVSDQQEESYDRLATWSSQISSSSSNVKQFAPVRKISNVSDDVFTGPSTMNKMNQDEYRDLPANYEEPWDSEEGQKKFSRIITRAEKTHEKRQSVDKSPGGVCKIVSSESKNNPTKQCNLNEAGNMDYEMAWESKSRQDTQVKPQPKSHNIVPSNYEDAWDLPEKQKQFEEKLLAARKQRVSQGQIREDDNQPMPLQEAQMRSPDNPNMRLISSSTPLVIRSDSCRSLGALAEKIDVHTPLEEQLFYHGSIKRSAAEKTLLVFKEGSYLVRKSETSKKDYSLTLKGWNGVPMHMKIACRSDGRYVLGEHSPPFKTIPEMVNYYTTHELPVQNADRICLLYPIPS